MPDLMGLTAEIKPHGKLGLVYERVPGTHVYFYVGGAPAQVRCPPFLTVCPHLGEIRTKLPEGMTVLETQYG